jgi:hypothetical protein
MRKIGINYRDIKECAWSEKPVKVIGEKSGDVHHRRTAVVAAIDYGKIMAWFYFDHDRNIKDFWIWFEKVSYPDLHPRQIIIMDNLSFDKSPRIREIIENGIDKADRHIRGTSTPLSISRFDSRRHFLPSGAVLPILMTDFPLLLILIMGLSISTTR